MTRLTGTTTGLGRAAAVLLAATALLLVPSWFGRPEVAWLLPLAAAAALGFDLLVDPENRAARPGPALLACLGTGAALGGVALAVAAVVRAPAADDPGALLLGGAALVAGLALGGALLSASAATTRR